jgi:hypothetical protein
LEESFILFFIRKLMPAFSRDNVQLVLTGLLVIGDEPPFEKVRAEEHESVAGTFGLPFLQTGLR